MGYEIDFIGIDDESTKSADAIAMRWETATGKYVVGVYDGGTNRYGEALVELLNTYYFSDAENRIIDFVICSHSDMDHASGLTYILENFTVKTLYMNRPWLYIDELYKLRDDGRITANSLEERLKEKYPYIVKLEQLAEQHGVKIKPALQHEIIMGNTIILSPSKEFYLHCLIESSKTPLIAARESYSLNYLLEKVRQTVCNVFENWNVETLREDVSTSFENETSVILLGQMKEETFLLTGDAGKLALYQAFEFARGKIDLKQCGLYQIPHHGSRHNVSPLILNHIIGKIQDEGEEPIKVAFVSAAKGSQYPRKMVANAFRRRGCKVYSTNGENLWHHYNMPLREEYTSSEGLPFYSHVESWDD